MLDNKYHVYLYITKKFEFYPKNKVHFKKGSDRIILEILQAFFGSCWGEGLPSLQGLPVRG